MKEKSYNDVMRQIARIKERHNDNPHYQRAKEIAMYYLDMIARYDLGDRDEKLGYEYRSFVYDTPREVIATLKPRKLVGLWFDYNGEKVTPCNLYFGIDTRLLWDNGGQTCGKCFTHYDNALHPVYLPNGERFVWYPLANVNCRYKNGTLYDFYRQ